VGYFLSEAQKRKEEEEQKQAEARRALDLAHAAEQESLAAMNAELRRQEEEERASKGDEYDEQAQMDGSSELYQQNTMTYQALWNTFKKEETFGASKVLADISFEGIRPPITPVLPQPPAPPYPPLIDKVRDFLKAIKAIISDSSAWIGLTIALQKVMLPPASDYRFDELIRNAPNITYEEFMIILKEIQANPQKDWVAIGNLLKIQIPIATEAGFSTVGLFETTLPKLTTLSPEWASALTAHGQVTTATVNMEQAARLFVQLAETPPARWGAGLANAPLSKFLLPFQVLLGSITYGFDMWQLATDPSLDPRVSGNNVWVPRIGVGLEGLGGGILAVAGLMILFAPPLAPVAAVLLPIGLVLGGIGLIVKNWDSISTALTNGAAAWPGIFENVKQIVQKLPDYAANQVSNGIMQAGTTISKAITGGGQALTKGIATLTQNAANGIVNVGQTAAKIVTKSSQVVSNAITLAGKNTAKVVTAVSQGVGMAVSNTAASAGKLVANISPAAGKAIINAGKTVTKAVTVVGQTVSNSVIKNTQTVAKAVIKTGQAVAKSVSSITKAAANTVSNVGKAAANTVAKVTQSAAKTVQSVTSSISKLFKR